MSRRKNEYKAIIKYLFIMKKQPVTSIDVFCPNIGKVYPNGQIHF